MDGAQACLPHDSTGLSPHELEMGFPMPLQFDWQKRTVDFTDSTPGGKIARLDAQQLVKTIHDYHELAKGNILRAQERMTNQANKHRRKPDFGVGDRVFIVKKVWSTTRPSDKLDYPLTR